MSVALHEVDLSERRRHHRYDVPVPFASDPSAGYGNDHRDPPRDSDLGTVVKARAIQCALSRVCGLCGLSLSGATTFVGTPEEADAGLFGFPPMHAGCADLALRTFPRLGVPVLGQVGTRDHWTVVVTGGFELERPTRRSADMRVLFRPSSVRERREVGA